MSDASLTNTIQTGQQRAAAKIQKNFEDLRDFVNGEGWIDSTKYGAGSVPDSALASSNNSAYRLLAAAGPCAFTSDNPASTYFLANGSALQVGVGITVGLAHLVPPLVYLNSADYAVSGKTTRLRVRAEVTTNATAPGITFTYGLYPVTFGGTIDQTAPGAGVVVSGSTAAIASPPASNAVAAASSDFAFPATGMYALAVLTNGTLANNSYAILTATLQIRHT